MDWNIENIHIEPFPSKRLPQSFFEKIISQDYIWGLRHPEGGWALCPSRQDCNHDVYLFWSERRLAYFSVHREWAEFEPVAIGLREFILIWLDDMIASDSRLGLDWDPFTEGSEVEAMAFKRRLCQRLNKLKKII